MKEAAPSGTALINRRTQLSILVVALRESAQLIPIRSISSAWRRRALSRVFLAEPFRFSMFPSDPSPPRMMLRMQSLQALFGYQRIDLRGTQRAVAQQHLQGAQVGAVVQQVGGEGVAQDVGRDTF